MGNSKLINHTRLSPHHSGKRTQPISRITPHCVVGQCTVGSLGEHFADPARRASSNYGIGFDGERAMYVPEDCCSWCSSSDHNDQRAVTIEVASDTFPPYMFTDKAYNSLVELCVDICKRNGKSKTVWVTSGKVFNTWLEQCEADKNAAESYQLKPNEMLFTVHRWYAPKTRSCPGDWLFNRMDKLVADVNAKLAPERIYRIQLGAFSRAEGANLGLEAIEKVLALSEAQEILKPLGMHKAKPFIPQ